MLFSLLCFRIFFNFLRYVGDWRDNRKTGKGTLTLVDGRSVYEGGMLDDLVCSNEIVDEQD